MPKANAAEAAVSASVDVRVADHLTEVIESLTGGPPLAHAVSPSVRQGRLTATVDMKDVKGQLVARRATEVAAAGRP